MRNTKKIFLLVVLTISMLPIWSFHISATDTPVTRPVGYQTTDVGENGSFDLRLVAVLNDKDYTQYDSLGFDVTITFEDELEIKPQTMTREIHTIYNTLLGGDYTYSSDQFNGEYFFALNCRGLYPELGTLQFSVTTFSVKNGVRTNDSTETFSYTKDASTVGIEVPAFTYGTQSALFEIGNGAYEYSYSNISSNSMYNEYLSLLETNDFTKYDDNIIDGNLFATYTKSYMQVNLAYYPNLSTVKLIWGPRGYLPTKTAPIAGVDYHISCSPSVTQLNREGAKEAAAGECYVVQLEDGSYVVVDGGPKNEKDQAALLQYLQSHMPATHDKPQVTWMITHIDYDHIALTNAFIAAYHSLIDINMVCYNFPDFNNEAVFDSDTDATDAPIRTERVATLEALINQYYPQADKFIFHSGQTLYLPGCQIDILMTHEDYYPEKFTTGNYTSAAWKMTFSEGGSFLVLGDCTKQLCGQMATVYGDVLQSDVLQVSHHGLDGGTLELYQKIDPKVCFWPIDQFRFENDGRCCGLLADKDDDSGYSYTTYDKYAPGTIWPPYNFNYWLRFEDPTWNRGANSGTRVHYHSEQTITIDMKTISLRTVVVSDGSFNGFDSQANEELIWNWGI